MRKPKIGRGLSWTIALVAVVALGAGIAWAEGVVYISGDDEDAAWLGVSLSEETEDPEGGARVDRVYDDSPAEEAGLQKGDVIQGVDGQVVRGPASLSKRIDERAPGDGVSLRLLRDGREMSLEVELGERKDYARSLARSFTVPFDSEKWEEFGEQFEDLGERYGEFAEQLGDTVRWRELEHGISPRVFTLSSWSRPKLGVELAETTPELREHFGGNEDAGVLVSKILPDMPAAEAGLEVGDLIMTVDGVDVVSAGEIVEELEDKEGDTFPIEVMRDGKLRAIEVTIPEPERSKKASGPRARVIRPARPVPPAPPVLPAAPAPPAPPALPAPPPAFPDAANHV
jgi:C-terminal processing protease CtpA/Prc